MSLVIAIAPHSVGMGDGCKPASGRAPNASAAAGRAEALNDVRGIGRDGLLGEGQATARGGSGATARMGERVQLRDFGRGETLGGGRGASRRQREQRGPGRRNRALTTDRQRRHAEAWRASEIETGRAATADGGEGAQDPAQQPAQGRRGQPGDDEGQMPRRPSGGRSARSRRRGVRLSVPPGQTLSVDVWTVLIWNYTRHCICGNNASVEHGFFAGNSLSEIN